MYFLIHLRTQRVKKKISIKQSLFIQVNLCAFQTFKSKQSKVSLGIKQKRPFGDPSILMNQTSKTETFTYDNAAMGGVMPSWTKKLG